MSDGRGRTTSSVTTTEKAVSEHDNAADEVEATQGEEEATHDTRDVGNELNSEATTVCNELTDASTSENPVHMAVHRASLAGFDSSSEFSPESLTTGHGQFVSSHRSLLYSKYNETLDGHNQRFWNGNQEAPDNRGSLHKNQDKDSETVLKVEAEGENRPRQGESRREMYTCDHCNKKFEILHDYIRHKDFECSENSPRDDMSPEVDDRSNDSKDTSDTNGGYVISGNVIMTTEQELINERRRSGAIDDEEEGELNIDEGQCIDETAQANAKREIREDGSNDVENSNAMGTCHDARSMSPGSIAESDSTSDKNDQPFVRNGGQDRHSTQDENDRNKACELNEAEKLSKDIMAAEAMAHAIQNMSAFAAQSGTAERPDISAIKYQVRMIQQQQAYQVQMLNFLQWQLALASANPHAAMSAAAANRPFNGGLPMNPATLQPGLMPGNPAMPGNPFMPQMMAAMAMNTFQGNGDSNGMADLAKARLMMGMQQPSTGDGSHPLRSLFPQNIREQDNSSRNDEEQRYQLKVTTDVDGDSNLEEKQDKGDVTLPPKSDSSYDVGDHSSSLTNGQIADDASSSHGSQEDGELRDGALKSTAEEHRHRCRFCHKIFGSDSALQIHIRSHTGERPFKCNICGNRFTTKGNLKVHFTRHKSKYPHIPMNGQPIPEYLDHVPTSNGVPYGMSILPEKAALERPRLHGNPSIHLSPQQAALLSQRDTNSQKLPSLFPSQMTALNGKTDSDLHPAERQERSEFTEERVGAADVASVIQAQLLQRRRAEFLESQWPNGDNKKVDMLDSRDPKSQMALLQAAMLPFLPGFAARQQMENVPHHMRYLLPQQLSALQSQMAASSSNGNGTRMDIRLPTLPRSTSPRVNNNVKHELHNAENMLSSRTHAPSSETSKLQRLVENIDRGRVLQKNECHICHRILSCQSALKLHYRTHTGERPYKCDLCSRAFTTRGNLRTHYSSVHRQQMRPLPPSNSRSSNSESYNCTLCTARFRDTIEFQRHMQMHAMVQVQQQQQNMLAVEQRSISPTDGSNATSKLDETPVKGESCFVKSEGSPHGSTSQARNDVEENVNGERDSPSSQPDSARKLSEMKQELPDEGTDRETSEVDKDEHGRESSVCTPPQMTSPLDSLAALSNLSEGSNGAGHTGSMLDHQLAALSRARAGRLTVCEICEKPFSCQSALEIHLRTHTKERPFICQICQRAFTTKGNLKQHLLTHNITDIPEQMLAPVTSPKNSHSTSSSPSSSPTPSDSQVVSTQKRVSDVVDASEPPSKRAFPRHWCHICQKQFSSASSLQIHNRTHTGEKPFACNVCGRAFTTKGNLKVHMGTHVWGAGGSRRGRRISMDNPLISPWMKNMTRAQPNQPTMQLPTAGQVTDPAALYQQYAALARGILSAKQDAASRFMMPMTNGQSGNSASSPVSSNGSPLPPTELGSPQSRVAPTNNPNITAATEWFLKAYQRTQEQVN